MKHADGGTFYHTSLDKKSLSFHIAVNDTLHMYRGCIDDVAIDMPTIPLVDEDGKQSLNAVAAYAANRVLAAPSWRITRTVPIRQPPYVI